MVALKKLKECSYELWDAKLPHKWCFEGVNKFEKKVEIILLLLTFSGSLTYSQPHLQEGGKGSWALGARVPAPSCLLSCLWPVLLGDELGAHMVPSTSWDQPEHPCHGYKIILNPVAAYLMEGKGWAWLLLASSSGNAGDHQFAVILESELAHKY